MARKYSVRNKKRKKSRDSMTGQSSAVSPHKPKGLNFSRENVHIAFLFLLILTILSSVYITCVTLEIEAVVHIYSISGVILFVVYYLVNGGAKRKDFSDMDKPETMGIDEFAQLQEHMRKRQKTAKYVFIFFVPFPLIVLMDYMIMKWL